jgi:hypothetical protein
MLHGDSSGGFAPIGTLPALDGGENSKLQKVPQLQKGCTNFETSVWSLQNTWQKKNTIFV